MHVVSAIELSFQLRKFGCIWPSTNARSKTPMQP